MLAVATVVSMAAVMFPATPAGANHQQTLENMTYHGSSVKEGITNSDLAFWGNRAYAGNYGGFRIIDISNPQNIEDPANVITDFSCPGPQNDISVWDSDGDGTADLLFLSVDSPRTDDSCASAGTVASNLDSWEGVRIFDISDEENPVHLDSVATDCGSHTHTLLPGDDAGVDGTGQLYIYVSSYPLGGGAVTNGTPKNDGTECEEPEPLITGKVHNKISIIRVSEADPLDNEVKEVALPLGGEMTHVQIGSRSFDFTGCHDIAAFMEIDRAVGACWREAIWWDISDPFSPLFLRRARSHDVDTLYHSVTFTWDGKIVALEDEAGGGGDARCKLEDGQTDSQGAMYFHTMNGDQLGEFKIPMHLTHPCTAHNYNVLPLTDGQYVLSSAWYFGGTWMVDFTNPAEPVDAGHAIMNSPPNGVGDPVMSDVWSSYWYNGFVFANDGLVRGDGNGERGLEVFSFNDPLAATAIDLPFLNPQTQMNVIEQTPVVPRCQGLPVTIEGTSAGEMIPGTDGADIIHGFGGADLIIAGAGADRVCGGTGSDVIKGQGGRDRLNGNRGSDILKGGLHNDTLRGGPGKDECDGGPGRNDRAFTCEKVTRAN